MSQLRRILVGYNFFPDGDLAVRAAATLAERAGATLYLLHAVEPYPVYLQLRFPTLPGQAMLEEVVLKTRTQLTELAESPAFSRLSVVTDVHIGKPFVELIRVCRRWQGDLIVVGVSARGEGRLLGSTTERILRKAPVPVLIVKHELTSGPKTILIPTDFSAYAKPAAEEALTLVRGFGGRAVFLHVLDLRHAYPSLPGAQPIVIPPLSPEDLEPDWQEFLHELPQGGHSPSLNHTPEALLATSSIVLQKAVCHMTSIFTGFPFTWVLLGTVTCSTPSFRTAVALSPSTGTGKGTVRAKTP